MHRKKFRNVRRDADFGKLIFFNEPTDEQVYEFRDILFFVPAEGGREMGMTFSDDSRGPP